MVKSLQSNIAIAAIPLLLLSGMLILTQTQFFHDNPALLSRALTLDLVLTIPLIYFIQIRNREIPKFTVLSVFIGCVIVASLIIPQGHQQLLSSVKKFALPIAELLVIIVVFLKVRKFKTEFHSTSSVELSFMERIRIVCIELLPHRFGKVLATEIGVLYYLVSPKVSSELKPNEYSYTRNNGLKELVYALIFIIAIETALAHYLLHMWSPLAANLCTLSSIYLFMLFISFLRSTRHHPVSIDKEREQINLRFGYFAHTSIKVADISSIVKSRKTFDQNPVKLSPFQGFIGHNIIIKLKAKQTIQRMYGFESEFETIGVYLDEPEGFIQEVNALREK